MNEDTDELRILTKLKYELRQIRLEMSQDWRSYPEWHDVIYPLRASEVWPRK